MMRSMKNTTNNTNETPREKEKNMNAHFINELNQKALTPRPSFGHLTKTYFDCPLCGSHKMKPTSVSFVAECEECGSLFGDTDLNSSARLVSFSFSDRVNPPAEETRYFDFMVEDWGGRKSRRHGWFDTKTNKMTQEG